MMPVCLLLDNKRTVQASSFVMMDSIISDELGDYYELLGFFFTVDLK